MSASCHGKDYFKREKARGGGGGGGVKWAEAFYAGCLQKKIWKNKRQSLTTLKSWIIQSIFWDFTLGGSGLEAEGWVAVGGVFSFCLLHHWLTVCVRGAAKFRRVYVVFAKNQAPNWQMQGVKYWLSLFFLFLSCVLVCVCAHVCVRLRNCPVLAAILDFISACYQGDISYFHLPCVPTFFALSSNRQEVTFKSIFHLCCHP